MQCTLKIMKLVGKYREQGSLISAARTVSTIGSGSVQMSTGCVLDRVSSFLKVSMLQWENEVLLRVSLLFHTPSRSKLKIGKMADVGV